MKVEKKKRWAFSPAELRKWRKEVFFLGNSRVQFVVVDLEDPICVGSLKPLRLSKDSGVIVGVFCLNEANAKKDRAYLIVAPYIKGVQAFVYSVKGNELPMVLDNPELRFIVLEERARVAKALKESEE